ncbi:hypothetical protein BU26DRAFT_4532 [Trematosphaeria pertusa]|uniref:Uncharacterized protein n=1 Tax=Trematosphaeria pertusa TaxID=390896 RepID=A0A6A6IYX5_9PLEO|nr:uncharacterized protein BU26DRAFT_4532 [Trematosphaeria pertusa]KAF2255624.1 hypothetical protein BU26DRAFT_4532 [Trematosphaeria pertusa]
MGHGQTAESLRLQQGFCGAFRFTPWRSSAPRGPLHERAEQAAVAEAGQIRAARGQRGARMCQNTELLSRLGLLGAALHTRRQMGVTRRSCGWDAGERVRHPLLAAQTLPAECAGCGWANLPRYPRDDRRTKLTPASGRLVEHGGPRRKCPPFFRLVGAWDRRLHSARPAWALLQLRAQDRIPGRLCFRARDATWRASVEARCQRATQLAPQHDC